MTQPLRLLSLDKVLTLMHLNPAPSCTATLFHWSAWGNGETGDLVMKSKSYHNVSFLFYWYILIIVIFFFYHKGIDTNAAGCDEPTQTAEYYYCMCTAHVNSGTYGMVVHQKHNCMFFTFFCTVWLHDVLIYVFNRKMTIINSHYIFVPLRDHCIILHVFMFVGCQYCRKWISYNFAFAPQSVVRFLKFWFEDVWCFRLFPWHLLLGNTSGHSSGCSNSKLQNTVDLGPDLKKKC